MPTSCKEAIAKWEKANNAVAAEAEHVKLFAQIPFIDKMDDSLNGLENCQHLSLSTNNIEKIYPLPVKDAAESNQATQESSSITASYKQLSQQQYLAMVKQQDKYT